MPAVASRTASLARNMSTGRPDSAAPTATRNATVTCSASSIPVVRLTTTLPGMTCLLARGARFAGRGIGPRAQHAREAAAGFRPGFSLQIGLQIDRAEGVQQAVLHREQGGGRAGRGSGLGVDALDMGLGGLGRDAQLPGHLPGGGAP